MKFTVTAAVAASALVFAGCATKPQYFHSTISDPAKIETQRAIDDGYCTSAAAGSVPMPQVAYQPTNSNTYQTNGTITGYGANGVSNYTYNGTIRQTPDSSAAFSQGFANGMNIGNAIAARKSQEKIHHGCMLALGWTTDPNAAGDKQRQVKAGAEKKWFDTIDEFVKTEASRPNGINYRAEPEKMQSLDAYVRALASDERNSDKTMLWFLSEADQLVKLKYGLATK